MKTGTRLEQYEILDKIGEGGMGAVYRADDTRLKRQVAVKVLPPEMSADPERMARMEREAQLLASLSHPNVATVHGFGTQQVDGDAGPQSVLFLVMELLDGQNLSERLDDGPIPWQEAIDIASGIALGLEAAHERGIVHRDLKPANVQLCADGTVKVLDFGLAKAYDGDPASGTIDMSASPTVAAATRTGMILGTAAYMSPEQARGKAVDKRADIWAFGCVLWETLTGRKAFHGETVSDVLASILKEEPDLDELPSSLPLRARNVIERCLQKNPKRRMRDIGDVRLELEEAKSDPVPAAGSASGEAWRVAVGVAAAAGVFLGALGAWMLAPAPDPPAEYHVSVARAARASFSGQLAISPDGRMIAEMDGSGGPGGAGGDIRVRTVDDPQWRTLPETAGSTSVMFTADGSELLFTRNLELLRVRTVGSSPINETTLTLGQGGAVRVFRGLDGETYLSGGGDDGVSLTRLDPAGPVELWRGEGQPVLVTAQLSERLFLTWSVRIGPNASNGVGILDLETGENTSLLTDYADARHLGGGEVTAVDSRGRLVIMRLDPGTGDIVSAPAVRVEGLAMINSSFPVYDVGEDGSLVYASGGAAVSDGETLAWLTPEGAVVPVSARAANYDADSRISPDGSLLALEIGSDGVVSIWIHDVERDLQSPLAPGWQASFPVWSPDGAEIIFRSDGVDEREAGVYRVPVDRSRQPELLLADPDGRFVLPMDWSPDGRRLIYVASNTTTRGVGSNNDLWMLPLDGGEPVSFVATTADEIDARFSPDGNWVAYASRQSGRYEIYLRAADGGGGEIPVSGDGGEDPEWSAGGTRLIFRDGDQVMSAPVDFGPPLRISAPEPVVVMPRGVQNTTYDVDPAGRGLLVNFTDAPDVGGLDAIFNWRRDSPQ